jgi:hypothetical protein
MDTEPATTFRPFVLVSDPKVHDGTPRALMSRGVSTTSERAAHRAGHERAATSHTMNPALDENSRKMKTV